MAYASARIRRLVGLGVGVATDFAGLVDGSHRHVLLGIAQLIMLGELAVNRVLDSLELKAEAPL
nr:hypothetical protein [Pseudomonas glycinae]